MFKQKALPLLGLFIAITIWHVGVLFLVSKTPIAASFSPEASIKALIRLFMDGSLWHHIAISLRRVVLAIIISMVIGMLLGLSMGLSKGFAKMFSPLFQLLRMISPLSWMPLAVMALGIGDAPVIFLLVFAAIWPIMLNTAAGVMKLDHNWLLLAKSLSATKKEVITRIVLPGILSDVLTGFRLALGVIWIVLVPAEMLGVSAGLGYFILDTRDRLAYDELTATILVIGFLGYNIDLLARGAYRWWTHESIAAKGF